MQTNIEKNVMRRIFLIRILRPLFSGFFVGGVLLVAALYGLSREVWVAQVFANGPRDFIGHSLYLVYAFEHTRLIVQSLAFLTLLSLFSLARETARIFSTIFNSPQVSP